MNARTFFVSLATLSATLLAPAPGFAHRVDEYLQATRLSVDVDRVDLEIDLTAGMRVASDVFGWIDANRDGRISGAETQAYAQQVLGSLVLSVDGRVVPVTLVEIHVPPFREMSLGVGPIRLQAIANLSRTAAGRHRLSYVNTYKAETSVYLVNALVPANPRVQIGEQRRDPAQHGITLDYLVESPSWSWMGSLLIGCVMACAGAGLASRFSNVARVTRDD
jgi:hypothetical protein